MRSKIILTLIVATLASPSFLSADCRRNTPQGGAFGIDTGSLCSFGSSEGPVIPIYGDSSYGNSDAGSESTTDSLFSEKERLSMLKSIVRRGPRNGGGNLSQAVSASSKPLGGITRRIPLVIR